MTEPFFKPDDFDFILDKDWRDYASYYANKKLEQHLGPVVYGSTYQDEWHLEQKATKDMAAVPSNFKESVWTALLFNIQPIKRECEHDAMIGFFSKYQKLEHACPDCGKRLQARWEEV